MLYQITAPHYCAGCIVQDGRVVRAAPILRWTCGKAWGDVARWAAGKGYGVALVD